jgi:uncharacterized protein YvpB
MKIVKVTLIALLFIIIGISGYYFYKNFLDDPKINGVELVSSEAIFVFETKEPIKAWNQFVNQPFWETLQHIPSFTHAESQLLSLDTLFGQSGNLDRLVKGNNCVISLHAVGKAELDFLISISFTNSQKKEFFQTLEKNIDASYLKSTRKYSGVTIYEVKSASMNRSLAYANIGNTIIGSYTSFLIEEAIRNYKNSSDTNFKSTYSNLFKALPDSKDLGVFRITGKGIQELASVILKENPVLIADLEKNNVSANLEITFKENQLAFNGEVFFDGDQKVSLTSAKARNSNLFLNWVSNRTAFYQEYQLPSGQNLKSLKNNVFTPKETILGDIEKKMLNQGFIDLLTGDLAYQIFETEDLKETDRIIIVKSTAVQKSIELIKGLLLLDNEKQKQSLVSDYYLNKEIFLINLDEFPAHLFEGKFKGFKNTYVTSLDSLLIFGNSSKAMKMFLEDLNNDNVWGKSIEKKKSPLISNNNSGLVGNVNLNKFWDGFILQSNPEWKVFFQKYAAEFQRFQNLNYALETTGKSQKINLQLNYNSGVIKENQGLSISASKSVKFPYRLVYGPKSIQNFIDKGLEFVVQDEQRILHLINNDGEIVFSKSLDSEIVSEVFQIDYYRNGKLQLLFATRGRLYIIDRLGESIPGFPKGFPSEEVTHLNLVDYSNTKDYRYFIGTDEGNIYLLDKEGNPLEGWSPKKLNGKLAVKPSHHRVAGIGDQMVLMTENGNLHLFNRKGEVLFDTPVKLSSEISNPYLVIERGSARDAKLVTLSATGEVIQVNMKGELLYRNQLLKPDKESKFHLVPDQNQNRYLFVIKEYNKITVLNSNYTELFQINYLADDLEFQFFSFGADKNILVVVDPLQEFTFLYDLKGGLLSMKPLNGANKIDIRYLPTSNEYNIFSAAGNLFLEYRLPL